MRLYRYFETDRYFYLPTKRLAAQFACIHSTEVETVVELEQCELPAPRKHDVVDLLNHDNRMICRCTVIARFRQGRRVCRAAY